jgi:mannitol-1-phosphate 5-dehydrogenase
MSVFVQIGAGNIGRSFIGRLFAEAGYELVFVDADEGLVRLLNERREYPVIVKQTGLADQVRLVRPVRAVNARDIPAVVAELVRADCAATSVGLRALDAVLPVLARGLVARKLAGRPALDLIIAENLRSGASFYRERLASLLGPEGDLLDRLGLVETSIGKMVPIMPQAALAEDPLQLFAEPYDTLIVDARGFLGPLPPLPGLKAVADIQAWVDRKLFMHNMSHAAAAWLGWQADPAISFIWQAMELPAVSEAVRSALAQSAQALRLAYPREFTLEGLNSHGADLLERYRNRALGDTVHRVGRDLPRKLARDDRLIGACLLAARQGVDFGPIARAARAALAFRAPDEAGRLLPADADFLTRVERSGAAAALAGVAGLDPGASPDRAVLAACLGTDPG